MPKMKTKSAVKKRFSLTASGKVRANQSGKRHNMRRISQKAVRNLRGTVILNPSQAKVIKKFLPNG